MTSRGLVGESILLVEEHALVPEALNVAYSKWRRALETAGVEFIEAGAKSDDGGPGVRRRSSTGKR
jgi:hypothetical protein